eukprot:86237_1
MSVFARAKFVRPKLARSVIANPALNTNPAFRNPAIVPFGIDFVDNDLRKQLNERQVDVDELESMYYQQCQNDAEFNAPKLPRAYDSKLWGFIYGERLVNAKHKLDSIQEEELFLTNYLNETVKELTMRMNRFYPNFDYKSQIKAANKASANNPSDAYTSAYNEALSEIISQEGGAQRFIGIFKNNAFVDNSDEKDFLPQSVEDELIAYYQFKWDVNSSLTNGFESYFESIAQLEQVLSPKIDSLSSHLRQTFAEWFLDCFAKNNLRHIADITQLVETSTDCVIKNSDSDSENEGERRRNTLQLLNQMEAQIELDVGPLLYGSNQIQNVELNESLLEGVEPERLALICKCLQIYEYLKYNSVTRLFLSCAISQFSPYFATFLNAQSGAENISAFESLNNDILDEIVSLKSVHNENSNDLVNSLNSLLNRIGDEIGNSDIASTVALEDCSFESPACFIASMIESSRDAAQSTGDILAEIKYLTLSKYLTKHSSEVSLISLVVFLMNPSRNGLNGEQLKQMAFHFSTNASDATDILLNQIAKVMKRNGSLDFDPNAQQSFKSALTVSLQTEFDNFKNICNEYNNSRTNLEQSIQNITLNFEKINFDHVQSIYDPLSTYLAQFRYYNNR